MSSDRVSATRGALQKTREQLKFIEKGKDILKMKRDQLAGEINKLLPEVGKRKAVQAKFMEAFDSVRYAFTTLGLDGLITATMAADSIEVKALPISIVGVVTPEVKVVSEPDPLRVPSLTMRPVAQKMTQAVVEAIKLGVLEAKVELLARELMDTNRKVNALEKVVIPRYHAAIRYIEDRLNEEALQEFYITKHIRDLTKVSQEREAQS